MNHRKYSRWWRLRNQDHTREYDARRKADPERVRLMKVYRKRHECRRILGYSPI